MMAVQLNPYQHLPLTITPVLHSGSAVKHVTPLPRQTLQPDLTFHCMCCKAYFMSPVQLYQHMNIEHTKQTPTLSTSSKSKTNGTQVKHEDDDNNCDYSWVFEPVCELLTDDSDSDSDSDKSNESDSTTSSSSDDDATTSSSSSTSGTSGTTGTANTNLNAEQLQTNPYLEPLPEWQDMEEAAYEEVEAVSMATTMTTSSGSSLSGRGARQSNELRLKLADTHESTSIILLKPKLGDVSIMPIAPHPVASVCVEQPLTSTQSFLPLVQTIKRRRGRRSMAAQITTTATNEQKCFQCSHCEASFPNAGDLSKHVRSHITNKPFQCSICQKTFTHIGSLNTHIRIHSGEKPYKCQLCVKAFTQSSSLMVHVRSHSVRKPYQCDKCDKGFINHSSLVMHKKTHTKTEMFVCPECEKEFKQESLLDEHMRMHTQEFVYQCSICRQAFRSSSELVQHMKCHLGEKPFTCSICDRSFTQSGSLNIHMRIHTGEKPFHCKLCDKSFTQASSLSVHMKIHTGEKPFPCHICGKSYSQQAYLNKHIQAHVAESEQQQRLCPQLPERLVCIVCGSLHKDATSLALHVTQQHTALLDSMRQAEMETFHSNGKLSEAERQTQQQQYMDRVHIMLQQMHAQQFQYQQKQEHFQLETPQQVQYNHQQQLKEVQTSNDQNQSAISSVMEDVNTSESEETEVEDQEEFETEEVEMQESEIEDGAFGEDECKEDLESEQTGYIDHDITNDLQMEVGYEEEVECYAAEEEVYTEMN